MPKVEKNQANLQACVCPDCPTYNDCAKSKTEVLFCAEETGKSACAFGMNGCICGNCPVHQANQLASGYFCVNGPAR